MDYEIIYKAANSREAHFIKGLLKQYSIESELLGENLSIGVGELPVDVLQIDILVPKDQIKNVTQAKPGGLAEAFLIGEEFIGEDNCALILGDNLFFGSSQFEEALKDATEHEKGALVFAYRVDQPQAYGVLEFDTKLNVISIEEKPQNPKSNFVVTGLYFYDNEVINIAKSIKRSEREELEITDINIEYLNNKKLSVQLLGRGHAWLDTGTHQTLLEASNFIGMIESRQGWKISCIEEIAYRMGYISLRDLENLSKDYNNEYGEYLLMVSKLTV